MACFTCIFNFKAMSFAQNKVVKFIILQTSIIIGNLISKCSELCNMA